MSSPLSTDSSPAPSRSFFMNQYIRINEKFWHWFILLSLVLTVVGIYFGTRVKLDTDLSRLLPQNSESVRELKILQTKAGGSYDLRLVLEGGPLQNRLDAADAFSKKLQGMPEFIRSVKYKTPKNFLEKYKYHLVPLESLEAIHRRVLREREKYSDLTDPLGLESSSEDKPAPSNSSSGTTSSEEESEKAEVDRAKNLIAQLESMSPYYQTKDGDFLAIRVVPAVDNLDIEKNRAILNQFKDIVKNFEFAKFHPEIKTSIYGSIPEHIARFDSISSDVQFGGIGILIILVVVALYFRTIWSLLVLTPPLVTGLAMGLGLTFLFEHTLNSITVFLVLVVFGMGIEFGIHLWARFLDERKASSAHESLLETWRTTGRATITSTLALFAGYGLLTISSFQGFAQFGRVAMILISTVALSFLVFMPSWILLTEAWRGPKAWPQTLSIYLQSLLTKFNRPTFDWSKKLRWLSVVLAICGALTSAIYLRFDYGFDDSVAQKNARPKSREALGQIFTERLKPSALAAFSKPEDAAKFIDYFEHHKAKYPDIPLMSGLSSFLPSDQDKRLEVLNKISDDIETPWLKRIEDPTIRRALSEIKNSAFEFTPILKEDLPSEMRDPFVATDKSGDSLVYLYDKGGDTDGRKAIGFSDAVFRFEKDSGLSPILSGQEIIFADVVRRVIQEGPWLVLGMLVFVFIICWLDFRSFRHAFSSMSPVLLGFLMTGLVLVLSHVQINFYNMIALASLGSMVVDNSIHLYHRFLENREMKIKDAAMQATVSVSPTVILCTTTSILGYGGMLFANHKGVASLGYVAVVGLVCCLLSSVVFLSAWLIHWEKRAPSLNHE